MGKVSALPKPANDAPPAVLPPFDITVTMNLSGERQIIVRAPFKDPVSQDEADRAADLLVRVAERQRSLQEIAFLTDELGNKRAALDSVWQKRKSEAAAKHGAAVAEIESAIVKAEARRAQLEQDFVTAERLRGKTGTIVLTGNTKSRHDALGRDIAALGDRVKKAEAEHLQHMQTIDGNVEKLTAEIDAIHRLLTKHREIVG